MREVFSRRNFMAAVGVTAVGVALPARAEDFPSQPLRIIVPYTPGGIADVFARVMGEGMAKELGQPVVPVNRPGANTMVGAAAAAGAPADGYTLYQCTNAMVLNPLLYKKLPYDPRRLTALQVALEAPLVLVVPPSLPVQTVDQLVAYSKERGRQLNYASVGAGNVMHLATEMLKSGTGARMEHVPYNGKSAGALSAVMSGEVQFMITVAGQALPQILAGKLRALAVTSRQRLPVLPSVPTVAELGHLELESATWYGLAVPTETPEDRMAKLRDAGDRVLAYESFKTRFSAMGLIVQAPRTGAEVVRYVEDDRKRWASLIQKQNITLD